MLADGSAGTVVGPKDRITISCVQVFSNHSLGHFLRALGDAYTMRSSTCAVKNISAKISRSKESTTLKPKNKAIPLA